MRKSLVVVLAMLGLGAAVAGPLGKARIRKPPIGKGGVRKPPPKKPTLRETLGRGGFPVFESSNGYKLGVAELETRSKLQLGRTGTREHTFRLEGYIEAPKEDDAVGITHELRVLQAADAEKHNLVKLEPVSKRGGLAAGKSKGLERYEANLYTFFHAGVASVEIPLTDLHRSGYTLQELELGAIAILAEERQDKETPAIVMEEPIFVVPGVTIRVTNLQMTRSRELTVVCKCERPQAGSVGAFIERITVLDEEKQVLASGRWNQGDAWAKSATLTAKLTFPGEKTHKFLRFTAVTKYSTKRMTFQVTGIFQK
jgi:hypothetical protein